MRSALTLLVLLSTACWRQDEFRSQCVLAGNCVIPEVDAGFDAGLEPSRWSETASLLFDVATDAGAEFDVQFVSNLSASEDTMGQCRYAGGVLTPQGSVLCIPFALDRAVEFLPDGRLTPTSIARPPGDTWAGGVMLDDGTVLGLPVGATTMLVFKPPMPNRGYDFLPIGLSAPAEFTGGARTLEGTLIAGATTSATFIRPDGGTRLLTGSTTGAYAGAVLTESGRSVLLVPRTATRLVEVTPRSNITPDRVTLRGTQPISGLAGGLLLESGDALLMPSVAGGAFVRVPADGGAPASTPQVARAGLFSAAWSTNGYAYSLEVDGGTGHVAVISRTGDVTWARLPSSATAADGGFFAGSHLGLTGMADGRLVSCGCLSSNLLILTPRVRRTVPLEVMTSPWLNKW
ncbi:MAG: hypothetical protein Q8S33_32085 [Myxococcales bacterium]|nr:hypothetical protein [Myxococcales bacterium]MDP3505022.1 hypothetical protein [Myxococcales bacterium]